VPATFAQEYILSFPAGPFSDQIVNSLCAIIPYHDRCLHCCVRLVSSDQEVALANREVMNYGGHKIFVTRTLSTVRPLAPPPPPPSLQYSLCQKEIIVYTEGHGLLACNTALFVNRTNFGRKLTSPLGLAGALICFLRHWRCIFSYECSVIYCVCNWGYYKM
jgi:hypothetical protein